MKKLLALCLVLLGSCTAGTQIEEKTFTVGAGETESLSMCYVRKHSVLRADVRSEAPVKSVTVGRGGRTIYWGAWVTVTADSAFVYEHDYFDDAEQNVLFNAFAHGLDVSHGFDMSVITEAPDSTGVLKISAGGESFASKIHWRGGGTAYITNDGDAPIDATLSFLRGDAGCDIWFVADSYFMEYDVERWPYYMVQEGHLDWLADHLPGGSSTDFIACFREDLKYGTPKIAVWMMGMNDFDDLPDSPNECWLSATQEFLDLCREHGVTPVLVTVPSVPERFHDRKAEWVRNSGCRYIDWYEAVGAKPWDGSPEDQECVANTGKHRGWDADYLYPDEVHPSESGAYVLWLKVKEALPELR